MYQVFIICSSLKNWENIQKPAGGNFLNYKIQNRFY